MFYNINIKAKIESNLSQDVLENQLVVALYNVENQYSKFDDVDNNLEVVDYEVTGAQEICPNCDIALVSKMFDIDGINLSEHNICEKCGYGKPALL